jgi:hypothetical protein
MPRQLTLKLKGVSQRWKRNVAFVPLPLKGKETRTKGKLIEEVGNKEKEKNKYEK